MKKLDINTIAKMTRGEIIRFGEINFAQSVHVDSRLVSKNGVFFALSGTATNGHKFLDMAVKNGASVLVVSEDVNDYPVCIIKVDDTFKAFQFMAKAYRNMFDIPFVAVTGSSGKTTTKDITACVLSQKYCVHKTKGNLNSSTGAPLTVFDLDDKHEISVIEMSMSATGEILGNADIVRPNTVIMTNIGVCHIEFLKTRENIFKAKCEILRYMEKGDTLILNADDDLLDTITSEVFDIKRIGIDNGDMRACNIQKTNKGVKFCVDIKGNAQSFEFPFAGRHNILNCLSAICVGLKYGLNMEQIQKGLLSFSPSPNRMEIVTVNGIKLINDTYNANPDSVKAALSALNSEANSRKIALLGDMYELGDYTKEKHRECGKAAWENGVELLIVTGDNKEDYINGYKAAGGVNAIACSDKDKMTQMALMNLKEDDTVLLKASRGVKLEEVFWKLKERLSQ